MRLSLRAKLISVFGLVFAVMAVAAAVVALFAFSARGEVDRVDSQLLPATSAAGDLHLAALEYHKAEIDYVTSSSPSGAQAARQAIAASLDEVNTSLATISSLVLPPATVDSLAKVKQAWQDYLVSAKQVESGDSIAELQSLQTGQIAKDFTTLDGSLDDLSTSLGADTASATSQVGSLMGLLPIIIVAGFVLAIVLGMFLAMALSRRLAKGIGQVRHALTSIVEEAVSNLSAGLEALASNDLTLELTAATDRIDASGSDEIAEMAAAANGMMDRLDETIANYERARSTLSSALAEVHDAATAVSDTSAQLGQTAMQSGDGSSQIARTISQVAAGAADQAHAASETSSAVGDLRSVIEQVRSGASETADSVGSQAEAVNRMSKSIRSASRASADLHSLGTAASEAASKGAETVRQTVEGMLRIKGAVEGAAVKVTELGAKGQQIGAIVETIDDIAEQTNLLALNAAIEAARAGEQGKGFAVVADEVRKLAERSSRATKEIATLIAEVQRGTAAAVEAMKAGASEVEMGAELAGRSGAALDEIASAVESSNAAASRIVNATEQMQESSGGLVSASDAIAAIAQETNAAAESMTENAERVSHAVESIAAISEQNSASAEEVSAATEELSAQAQEVVAAVTTLSSMAGNLESLAARFKISRSGPVLHSAANRSSDDPAKATDRRAA